MPCRYYVGPSCPQVFVAADVHTIRVPNVFDEGIQVAPSQILNVFHAVDHDVVHLVTPLHAGVNRPPPAVLLLLPVLIEADMLGAAATDMDMLRSSLSMYACTYPADVMMGGSSLAN